MKHTKSYACVHRLLSKTLKSLFLGNCQARACLPLNKSCATKGVPDSCSRFGKLFCHCNDYILIVVNFYMYESGWQNIILSNKNTIDAI